MRSLTTLLAFAALGGVFYAADSATRPPAGTAAERTSAAAIGLARLIRERAGLDVTGIVTAPSVEGRRDFRGLLRDDGRLRPVYGRVSSRCPAGADRPDCWEIAHLEIDGEPAGAARSAASEVVRPAAPGTAGPPLETADIPRPKLAPGAPHQAAPATPDVPEKAALATVVASDQRRLSPSFSNPAPTHAVDRPVINARSGPGTENQVVARLPEGFRLAMIEEQDGWGRFLVLDGDGRGQEIWAALRILKAVP